ncbi:MobF family relaxase [Muricoccus vinaceus]|uniref:MobF family relaxase n=1 Tax=Muricoccus vinaceus TaxID=424704 RepID=A0ABV6IZT4_9PROT
MAAHLNQKTLPAADLTLSEYYSGGRERQARAQAAVDAGMNSLPVVRVDIDPRLAEALKIAGDQILNNEELAHVLRGQAADGEDLPGANRKPRAYEAKEGEKPRQRISYADFTFSAPKSVSVAWYKAKTPAERNSIVQAHRAAADAALRYMEKEIACAGFGDGHRQGGIEPAKMAWIRVDHFTSRPTVAITRPDPTTGVVDTELYDVAPNGLMPGDPQLHSHCIVPNLIATESGRLIAMNRDLLDGRVHEFGGIYQMILGAELRKLGIDVELDERTNTVRLPCIPEAVCEEFSKRTAKAEEAAREMAAAEGFDWDTLDADRQVALLKSRAQAGRRGKGDDLASWVAWDAQSEKLIREGKWWRHESAVAYGPPAPERSRDERFDHAYEVGLQLLEQDLMKRAVVTGAEVRLACARALIAAGAEAVEDVGVLARGLVTRGVRQAGEMTRLLWRELDFGRAKVTTELHRDQEAEVIRLAQAAAADKRRAIPEDLLNETLAETAREYRIDYSSEAGRKQEEVARRVAAGGEAQLFLGVGGAGKTKGILPPLVKAWHAQGRDVWGTANAWKQARGLSEAGINRFKTRALQPFVDGLEKGDTKLTAKSVVVVDELSQVGTRQLLTLLRLRDRIGFSLVMTGGERQCQSIEAGPVIELLRRAFGEEAIPNATITIRQRTEREREITGYFETATEAGTRQAITMKREDGNAVLVPGGYNDCVRRVAALWLERWNANHDDPEYAVTIAAPTNADALAISREVRSLLQAEGQVGREGIERAATDKSGNLYTLDIGVGDRLRLFQVTRGLITDGKGRRRDVHIGDNASVVTVRGIEAGGLTLETESGTRAFVRWDRLTDRKTGRVNLSYAYCMTIDSSQGMTSHEHILAMPGGSSGLQAFKLYSGASRHRVSSYIVGSMAAEMAEVGRRRPIGPRQPVAIEEAWENVIRNFSRAEMKELATDMLAEVQREVEGAADSLRQVRRNQETREAAGHDKSTLRESIDAEREEAAVADLAAGLEEALAQRAPLLERMQQAVVDVHAVLGQAKLAQLYRVVTRSIARGVTSFADGLASLIGAELRTMTERAAIDPVHDIPKAGLTDEEMTDLEDRVESRLLEMLDAYEQQGEQAFDAKLSDAEVQATLEAARAVAEGRLPLERADADLEH